MLRVRGGPSTADLDVPICISSFRRFRSTHLRKRTGCPDSLLTFGLGHTDKSMGDIYNKIKENVVSRREWAEKRGSGFEMPL